MDIEIRASNPRYPGSPARMADGRLFTDYRANCNIIGGKNTYERKEKITHMGIDITNKDRAVSVAIAGTTGCVDTMVPELTKRVCDWNGCRTLPSEAVGIGQGRLYWPGTPVEDPDVMAAHVTIPNSYPSHSGLYASAPAAYNQGIPAVPAKPNRYSAPYYA